MQYRQLIERTMKAVPRAHSAAGRNRAMEIIQERRLELASRHPWPFLLREGVATNGGGYEDGKVTVTQDSRTVTLTTGSAPSNCAGWHFIPSTSQTERYKIATRSSATVLVLDRPYEGDSATNLGCILFDPYAIAPRDLARWKSIRYEYGDVTIDYEDGAWFDAYFTTPRSLGSYIDLVTLAEPTTDARYNTGTVTVTKGSPTVTGSGVTWPEWCVGRHLQFNGEEALYKIKSRDSDTQVTLTRDYGGMWAGSGISYELDPPGAIQLEVMGPVEDQYALKIRYYCFPQMLVNDDDPLEGPDPYQQGLLLLCQSDFIIGHLPDPGPEGQSPAYVQMLKDAQDREARGERLIAALIGGTVPPDQFARMRLWHRM